MPIRPADQQRLDTLYSTYKTSYNGRREDYFAIMYLTRKFAVTVEEISHQVAFGNNDYGIDAYYLNASARNLYLFQFKWTEDHAQFKGSMERLAKDGLQLVFGGTSQDPKKSDVLSYLRKDLAEHKDVIDRVYLHFVFKGDPDAVEKSEGLGHRREDLENKAHLIRQYFGRDVEFQTDFISDRPGANGRAVNQSFRIRFSGSGVTQHAGHKLHVGFVRLSDLHDIHRGLGPIFFDRNIRAALSHDNTPNKKIREALDRIVLKESEEPSVFAFRHNGVTIAADRVNMEEGHVVLHVPRLLNGAQTVSSLGTFLGTHADNVVLRRNRNRLDSIEVLAKIVEDEPTSDFVTQVTISNNQQNPVPPWALRAMDRRQVDFADKFRDELAIYYSRQEGAFETLSEQDLEEMGIDSDKDIRIRQLAMTFLAVQGELGPMKKPSDVFESQKLYDSTFRASYLNADARAIVVAYKVGQMLPRAIGQLRESMPAKWQSAISMSRNLTWALLVQALLNDDKYPAYREDYGTGLTKEASFADVLRQQTRTKIVPLLKDLCNMPAYESKIAEGKFDFLRTAEAYKRAMDFARDRFGWSKHTF